jgi:hypothetical protein
MRGSNLVTDVIQRKERNSQDRKLMLSISEEIYLGLSFETGERGLSRIQETIRLILSEWYKQSRHQSSILEKRQSLVDT